MVSAYFAAVSNFSMTDTAALFFNILFFVCLFALLLGMVKPWYVLWFLDFKNRTTVLRYYGFPLLALFLARLLFRLL
jgi:hypothetical protein